MDPQNFRLRSFWIHIIIILIFNFKISSSNFCFSSECCNNYYVPHNTSFLRDKIKEQVFGQPFILEIVDVLDGHIGSMKVGNKKALGISLQGWPGTGKNFVSTLIAEALFKNGLKSKYVKLYSGRGSFPRKTKVTFYQEQLKREISTMVEECDKSLIIFDEVDDIPTGVLNVIKPMLEFYDSFEGVVYRNVIFLFLSNINANEITDHFLMLNKDRDSLRLSDFDEIIRKDLLENGGGLENAKILNAHLIDHFIPFLPLEEIHIDKCIEAELKRKSHHVNENIIKHVKASISFSDTKEKIAFAGCKKIRNEVEYLIRRLDEL